MDYRDLQPFPEENSQINKLLSLMSMNYEDWEKTEFHEVKKEIFGANINW